MFVSRPQGGVRERRGKTSGSRPSDGIFTSMERGEVNGVKGKRKKSQSADLKGPSTQRLERIRRKKKRGAIARQQVDDEWQIP